MGALSVNRLQLIMIGIIVLIMIMSTVNSQGQKNIKYYLLYKLSNLNY